MPTAATAIAKNPYPSDVLSPQPPDALPALDAVQTFVVSALRPPEVEPPLLSVLATLLLTPPVLDCIPWLLVYALLMVCRMALLST
mmetsp:Transcript_24031/g.39747  ORF Transcript_24031/g.39747 Transcript_24031/m.39747 type:complete len:86 (+) Transcript_24031:131-388(+)